MLCFGVFFVPVGTGLPLCFDSLNLKLFTSPQTNMAANHMQSLKMYAFHMY